jgi:hypothetical protein
MQRVALPTFSQPGQRVLDQYEQILRSDEDLSVDTIRIYLSDVCHFAACCEAGSQEGEEYGSPFSPEAIAMLAITAYCTYRMYMMSVLMISATTLVTLWQSRFPCTG